MNFDQNHNDLFLKNCEKRKIKVYKRKELWYYDHIKAGGVKRNCV